MMTLLNFLGSSMCDDDLFDYVVISQSDNKKQQQQQLRAIILRLPHISKHSQHTMLLSNNK